MLEESNDEEDLSLQEQTLYGTLIQFYPVRLLRAYWKINKLKTLFPWQIECLSKLRVVE